MRPEIDALPPKPLAPLAPLPLDAERSAGLSSLERIGKDDCLLGINLSAWADVLPDLECEGDPGIERVFEAVELEGPAAVAMPVATPLVLFVFPLLETLFVEVLLLPTQSATTTSNLRGEEPAVAVDEVREIHWLLILEVVLLF